MTVKTLPPVEQLFDQPVTDSEHLARRKTCWVVTARPNLEEIAGYLTGKRVLGHRRRRKHRKWSNSAQGIDRLDGPGRTDDA